MKQQLQLLFLLVAAGSLCGCGTLDKSGAYQGDRVLYDADFAIASSYDLLHTFVKWEYENRGALAGKPEIRQAADRVRIEAPRWISSAIALRDAYKSSPTSANRDAIQKALDVLRAAIREATQYLGANPT